MAILCAYRNGTLKRFVSQSQKNPGHSYYKCSAKVSGCDYFCWADELRHCPCREGPCLILTSHTKRNPGHRFYRCPREWGSVNGCGFFSWVDGTGNNGQQTQSQSTVSGVDEDMGRASLLQVTPSERQQLRDMVDVIRQLHLIKLQEADALEAN